MSAPPLSVLVVGAAGRLGSEACAWIDADPELSLVGRVGRGDSLEEACRRHEPLVALDVTVAGRGAAHGLALLRCGVRPLIGTSGVRPEEARELDAEARARRLGGLIVPNFSLGAALLERAAAGVAAHWPVAATILETHHAEKRDAPSGTALALLESLRRARPDGEPATEPQVHSLRTPGATARHEVRFTLPGEELVLDHRVLAPEAYRPGLLLALRHVATRSGVGEGLAQALGLA